MGLNVSVVIEPHSHLHYLSAVTCPRRSNVHNID